MIGIGRDEILILLMLVVVFGMLGLIVLFARRNKKPPTGPTGNA